MSGASVSQDTERATSSRVPPVESFQVNGDLNLTLNRSQWLGITRGLAIAAGESAIRRDFDQMLEYNGICSTIATRLGVNNTASTVGDLSPPMVLAAGVGRS